MVQAWREGDTDQGGQDAGKQTENTQQRIWHWAPGDKEPVVANLGNFSFRRSEFQEPQGPRVGWRQA